MAKYHINSKGNPVPCRATKGKCPFGGADQHFGSRQEAFAEAERRHEREVKAETTSSTTSDDGFSILFRRDTFDGVEEGVSRVDKNGDNQHYLRKKSISGDRIFVTYLDEDGREDCDGTFPSCSIYSKPIFSGEKPKKIGETYSVHGVMYREDDLPSHLVWNERGNLVYQSWTNELGNIERNGDKPAEIEVNEKGNVVETYWPGGLLGRDGDKPAVVERTPSGVTVREEWYQDGIPHRFNGPAKINYFESGQVSRKEWYQDGVLTRDDGPAVQIFTDTGQKSSEEWYKDGKMSREDGPAMTFYHDNGKPRLEQYWRGGLPYRDNNEATLTEYNEDGKITYQEFSSIGSNKDFLDMV